MFEHRTRGGAIVGRNHRDSNYCEEEKEAAPRHKEGRGINARNGRGTFDGFKKKPAEDRFQAGSSARGGRTVIRGEAAMGRGRGGCTISSTGATALRGGRGMNAERQRFSN